MKLEHKYSAGRILESLSKANCSLIQQNYYMFDYFDEVLKDIGDLMNIDFAKRVRTLGDIKHTLADTIRTRGRNNCATYDCIKNFSNAQFKG